MDTGGVVRIAVANMTSRYVRLRQRPPGLSHARQLGLGVETHSQLDGVPLAVLEGRSHSGEDQGIMRNLRNRVTQGGQPPLEIPDVAENRALIRQGRGSLPRFSDYATWSQSHAASGGGCQP